jgi:CheY-like chemotaxis protein
MPEEPNSARILVVDDDAGVREVLQSMLEAAGYTVLVAVNGREALAALRESAFDCIITDLVMPEQEGIETIKMIRRDYPDLGIIAMSGAFGGDYLRIASYLGAHATLAKPVQLPTLLATVSGLVGPR